MLSFSVDVQLEVEVKFGGGFKIKVFFFSENILSKGEKYEKIKGSWEEILSFPTKRRVMVIFV